MEIVAPFIDLVQSYNNFNKLSLEFNNLICAFCNSWLKSPIYHTEQHRHICGNCKEERNIFGIRDVSLENVLNGTSYPCKFLGCYHMDRDIVQHEAKCLKNFECVDCGKLIGGRRIELIDHFTNAHAMEVINVNKPILDIIFTDAKFPKYYNCRLAANSIVVKLMWDHETKIMKFLICDASGLGLTYEYILTYEAGDVEMRKRGNIVSSLNCVSQTKNIPYAKLGKLEVRDGEAVSIAIYFAKYEEVLPYNSLVRKYFDCPCPICQEPTHGNCCVCPNHHKICETCAAFLEECPKCGADVSDQTPINLHYRPIKPYPHCKNRALGCFTHILNKNNMINHEIDCPFKSITCPKCKRKGFNKVLIVEHMIKEHGKLID